MGRTLLVTHTRTDANVAERARVRVSPSEHLELAGRRGAAKGVEDVLSADARQSVERDAMRWLKRMPGQLSGRRALAEALIADGVSLWWWVESPLWFGEASVRLSPPMPELLTQVEAVRAAAEAASVERIAFSADHASLAGAAIRELAQGMGLAFGGRTTGAGAKARIVDVARPAALRRVLLRRRSFLPPVEPRPVRVLLVSHTNALRKVADDTRDVYLGPLAEELAHRGVEARTCYVNAAADTNPRGDLPPVRLPGGGFFVDQSITENPAGDLPARLRDVLDAWRDARSRFSSQWVWRGIPVASTFDGWLGRLIRRHAPSALYYTAVFKEIIAAWRPEVVVVTNETGYAGRAVVSAARSLGVRSVGVQHGLIGPHHVEYVHPAEAVAADNRWRCPIPDVTAVDGEYFRSVLTGQSAYPAGSVVVTGQMRYEASMAGRTPGGRRKDMILVATQPVSGMASWVTDVLDAVGSKREVILKVHPLEDEKSYRRVASGKGRKATVVRDADLFELLSTTSLLVTRSSTMIIEAALADCPVVVYNPTGLPDPVPFADFGGGTVARTPEELNEVLSDLIGGGQTRHSLEMGREAFLTQFAHGRLSGAASGVADVVLSASVR